MFSFFKKLFSKKSEKQPVDKKITAQIKECEQAIVQYEQDIYQFKKKSREIISGLFYVPQQWKLTMIEKLDDIIQLAENKEVSDELRLQTQEIINAYKQQIQIRQQKINLCIETIKRLKKMLAEYYKKNALLKEQEQKIELLKKHSKFAQQEPDKIDSKNIFSSIINLQIEINKLERELEIKKIILVQMAELYYKYGSADNIQQAQLYEHQVRELLSEMSKYFDNE